MHLSCINRYMYMLYGQFPNTGSKVTPRHLINDDTDDKTVFLQNYGAVGFVPCFIDFLL